MIIYNQTKILCPTYFRKMFQNCSEYQVTRAARTKCLPCSVYVPFSGGQAILEYGDGPEKLTKGAHGIRFVKYA